jgi:rubredoxin
MIWNTRHTVRVLARGGILTPSHLLKILEIVKSSGEKHVHFGSRQDLLFRVNKTQMPTLKDAFASIQTDYIIHGPKETNIQNIVSAYVSSDMVAGTTWLKAGNYLNILEDFTYLHKLRINIADPKQSLIPLFYGHLNFVTSPVKDYWYLFVRKDYSSMPESWPVLILSNDLAKLSRTIETKWKEFENASIADMFEWMETSLHYNWRKIEVAFKLESIHPQDYEGFGRMYNTSNYWAGFYWRNNNYDIAFLEEVCHLCLRTSISKICLTSWKSFLIKEIKESELLAWQRLLGRFGINMRHSSFELNWHLPLQNKHALRLKRFLVKAFEKLDISVHGLTFGIKTKPEPAFCAIQIERTTVLPFLKKWNIFKSYRVLYAKNFDANTCEYEEYLPQVARYRLPEVLQFLTQKYYAQLSKTSEHIRKEPKSEKTDINIVHQCLHCLTVYNDKAEETPFARLPESFVCPLCDAPKTAFRAAFMNAIIKNATA